MLNVFEPVVMMVIIVDIELFLGEAEWINQFQSLPHIHSKTLVTTIYF